MSTSPLAIAVCCREWPVDPLSRMGRCGFCGERPVIDWALGVPPVWADQCQIDPWPKHDGDDE